ncbi:MAG: threonine--tRNA ligase, partial [Anaerohalosphaera sp.]|nr:threonine--tRNA ligase [Anaerohalosphaera sp.]
YGPKIDFHIEDCLQRSWQLGTIQLDFSMPERFGLTYTDSDNTEKQPVMIHRALLGSLERFLGILIEHFAGAMPPWLAPEQIRILPISEKTNDYASDILSRFNAADLRGSIDTSDEKIGAKIAKAYADKVSYLLVVGPKEVGTGTVGIRTRGSKETQTLEIDDFIKKIKANIASRSTDLIL